MKTTIRIKAPLRWQRNYLVDALKKEKINGKYTKNKIEVDTELLISNYLTTNELNSLSRLKYLIIPTSGTEGFPIEQIKKREVEIFQDKKVISNGVTHYLIDNLRKLSGTSLEKYLKNKQIGLLGFGYVGKSIYESLKIYGSKFLIFKRTPIQFPENAGLFYGLRGLSKILESCDILINTLPLSKETKSICLDKTRLIQKGAVVVNLSRSKILNEKEILDKVVDGTLNGCIFDVYPSEIDSKKYQKFKNIILTPHMAAIYDDNLEKIVQSIKKRVNSLV